MIGLPLDLGPEDALSARPLLAGWVLELAGS